MISVWWKSTSEEPTKFANAHKIFGASNFSKLLNEIPPHQREDAVNSLAYEADARLKDQVYGCVGAISVLQRQVVHLQREVDAVNADLMRYTKGVGGSTSSDSKMGIRVTYPYQYWITNNTGTGGDDGS
ncbi:LOB domain-containing protein 25-like [Dorcoceras hygrometricum]|uniref:LOB domain-containing protein 25-like n=1 Tax=Dorcoceras hygrometricum TaxID=472368 RepID=A0A2Z7CF72_9LAMI|nr:LOB domain-containing protein 25-like [Dorcoceras hygrometricum]